VLKVIPLVFLALLANMAPPPSAGAQRFDFSTVTQGMYCLAEKETVAVCTNRAELDSILARFAIGQDGDFAVDFSARVVLVVFLGQRPATGYSIEPVGVYEFYSNEPKLDPWNNLRSLLGEDGVNLQDIKPDPSWHAGEGLSPLFIARLVVLREKCPRKWTTIKGMPSSPWIMLELRVSYTGYRMDNMYLRVMACEGGD